MSAQYIPDAAAPQVTPQIRGIQVTGLVSWRRIFQIFSVVDAPVDFSSLDTGYIHRIITPVESGALHPAPPG